VDANVPSHFVPCPGQLSWWFFRVTGGCPGLRRT
jgi:hypothetical protein